MKRFMRSTAAALIYGAVTLVLCLLALWRYEIFRNGVDLGIFTQVIASTGSTFSSTVEGNFNHLLVHWSPLIALGYPLLKAFGPVGLQYLQAALVAATLLPIWGMARARFSPVGALIVVIACACYPILLPNALGDFHEMAFVPFLAALFVYAIDGERWVLGTIAALLLACVKEDQFVSLAWNGAVLLVWPNASRSRRAFGLAVFLLGVLGLGLYFEWFRYSLPQHLRYWSFHFYDWTGYHPTLGSLWSKLVLPRLRFILATVGPPLLLPLLSPYALFLVPGLVEILASHESITMRGHYDALLTGYVLAAFVDGLSRISKRVPRSFAPAVGATITVSLVIQIFASPLAYWYYYYRLPNAGDRRLQLVLDTFPRDADVGAEDEIFAHLGLDPKASLDMQGQTWFVYDAEHYSGQWHDVDEPLVKNLVAHGAYAVTSKANGIVVLHRRWTRAKVRSFIFLPRPPPNSAGSSVGTADFRWVAGKAAARCPAGWKLVAGGSNPGPGFADFKTQSWQLVGRGTAYASCADATAAKNFTWVRSSRRRPGGEIGATCPPGYVLVNGFGTNETVRQWVFQANTSNNTYWVASGTAWASCARYADVNVLTVWGPPPVVSQPCPAGSVVIGGSMGSDAVPGPAKAQYPDPRTNRWYVYALASNRTYPYQRYLNIAACAPRYFGG